MSDTRKLALELHEIRQLALSHATNPQFGNSSVDGEGLSFRDGDGNEIGRIGGGENGMEVEYTYGPKPLMPSTPIVTADANLLLVQWDGLWAGGNEDGDAVADPDLAAQAGLDRVEVHVSMEPTFVPDPILSFAGVLPVTPEGGAHTVGPLAEAGDYYVVLMARGKDGQYSAPSQRVHVVTTVGLMENELFDLALRADEARESADGKNTVHYGEEPVAPEGGFSEGDLWFDTTEDPETGFRKNTPYLWDPAANNGEGGWVSASDSRFQAIRDAQDALEADVDAVRTSVDGKNAITQSVDAPPAQYDGSVGDRWERMSSMGSGGSLISNWRWNGDVWVSTLLSDAVIANLDASKISTGFLDAARLAAGSVQASSIAVGDFSNFALIDPVQDINVPGRTVTDGEYTRIAPGSSETFLFTVRTNSVPFQAGDSLRVSFVAKADDYIRAQFRVWAYPQEASGSTSGQRQITGSWFELQAGDEARREAVLDIPDDFGDGVVYRSWLIGLAPSSSSSHMSNLGVREAGVYRQAGATLIQDGAITTEKIAVGAITAESGIIGSLDAGVIAVGELRGELIRAQSIAGESLAVDAIDGKTITGATVRTSSAGARVEMDSTGLFVKNSLGANTVSMTNGTLTMLGGTITGGTIRTHTSGARVQLDTGGLKAWNPSNEETFSISANTGTVRMTGDLHQANSYGNIRVGPTLYTDAELGESSPAIVWGRSGLSDHGGAGIRQFGNGWDTALIMQGPYKADGVGSLLVLPRDTAGGRATGIWRNYEGGKTPSSVTLDAEGRAQLTASGANAFVRATPYGTDGASTYLRLEPSGGVHLRAETVSGTPRGWLTIDNTGMYLTHGPSGHRFQADSDGVYVNGSSFGWGNSPNSTSGGVQIYMIDGYLYRRNSSREGKILIEDAEESVENFEDRILSIRARTYYGKREAEDYADYLTALENGEEADYVRPPERTIGVVAEEVAELGLEEIVSRNADESIEGVDYNNLSAALIPVVRRLRDRVNELEEKMGAMANA